MAYRERQKISQMTPKGANLAATDLIEVSELVSGSYVTKSITGQEIINAAGGTGTVTSVDLTMPSAFNVTGNPITTSGTLAVTGAGVVSQYVRGDGSLANFPSVSGGGASTSYYLNGSVSQGTIGGVTYYEMNKTPILGTGTDFIRTNGAGNGYIASFLTDANDPNLLKIPGGNWNLEFYFSASSSGSTPSFYVELYKYDGTTFTLIASNSANPEIITGGTSIDAYFTSLSVPETILVATDRLAIRVYVTTAGRTITLHTEDNHLCQVITTFTTGLTALNGLTDQVQNFATGTSGTDFGINSTGSTHTFNLPTASATNRGALSTTDWSAFNGKFTLPALTSGSVLFSNGTTIVQDNTNLFWDNSNKRLGIGTASPTTAIDVNGTIRVDNTSFTGNALTIAKTANNTTRITAGPSGAEYIQFGPTNTILLNAAQVSTSAKLIVGTSIEASIGGSNSLGLQINNVQLLANNQTRTGITLQNNSWGNTGAGGASNLTAVKITPNINHTLGTTSGTVLLLDPIINTTGGTHTIRGLYYNPTLTSTTGVTHRSIETTTGDVIFASTSGNVAIGSSSPGARLDVRAQGALSTDIAFRVRNSADTRNFLTVNGAGDVFSNGAQGVSSNAFYGENSGRSSTGLYNCFFGLEAGRDNSTGTNNSFFGVEAGRINTTGSSNSFFGIQAGRSNTGSSNSFFGAAAGTTNSTGTYNSFFGVSSGESNSTGAFNSCFGFQAGQSNSTGSENVFLGVESGRRTSSGAFLTVANNSIFLGGLARANANSETNQIVIGHSAIGLGSNTTVIGNTSTTRWKLFGAGIVQNITAPSSSLTDSFHVYSNDITAGNAAPHFRTENGNIIKLYTETTAVAAATFVSNTSLIANDTATFDGYTIGQVVKALRNLGILA